MRRAVRAWRDLRRRVRNSALLGRYAGQRPDFVVPQVSPHGEAAEAPPPNAAGDFSFLDDENLPEGRLSESIL